MTYSHFLEVWHWFKNFILTQLHNFSISFINVLSFCRCLCYLVFHMLFPSISMTVSYYTCITSTREYSKSIRLLFKGIKVPYYGVLHYLTAWVTYVTLQIPSTFKIRSPTRPACTYWHAGLGPCISFYSGSFAEEVTKYINYHKTSFLL